MMSSETFEKKKIIFIFPLDGDKISFQNENLVLKDSMGEIRLKTTCYRIFAVMIVGPISLTSVIIDKSHKYGFPIFIMTQNMRTIDVIGHSTEGNYILNRKQYAYDSLDIAKTIMKNKILNQADTLNLQRAKSNELRKNILKMKNYVEHVEEYDGDTRGLMGIEGTASKIFFQHNYDLSEWTGRRPRVKMDYINSTLDIGYTILFNMVDAMIRLYGFDAYVGVYHKEFYKRKSLVCDLVEPFRPLIDWQVRKAVHLGQCKSDDFNIVNGQYRLDIRKNAEYSNFLVKPLLENKIGMFDYFKSYYRAFIRDKPADEYPMFRIGDNNDYN